MTDQIHARLVPNHAGDAIRRARLRAPGMLAATLKLGIEAAKTEVQQETPVGWSGALRGSYATEIRGAGSQYPKAILANPLLYHDAVEDGRRAGKRPPVSALVPWVGSKLGIPPGPEREAVAFLIARKIGRRGTQGQHMVATGWAHARAQLRPLLQKLGYDLVKEIR